MTEKLPPFDAAQYLQTPEDISFFLNDTLATDNIIYIAHAIGVVVRAKGMTDLSAETGIAIDELHRIFSGDKTTPSR